MRHRDWTIRMWQTLDAMGDREFALGDFDCIRMAAMVIDAMVVDSHILLDVTDMYHDKRSAIKLIMRSNGLDSLVTAKLGQPGPRAWSRQGDVVSVDLESGPAVGICVGMTIAVAAAPTGVAYLPLERGLLSWKVD